MPVDGEVRSPWLAVSGELTQAEKPIAPDLLVFLISQQRAQYQTDNRHNHRPKQRWHEPRNSKGQAKASSYSSRQHEHQGVQHQGEQPQRDELNWHRQERQYRPNKGVDYAEHDCDPNKALPIAGIRNPINEARSEPKRGSIDGKANDKIHEWGRGVYSGMLPIGMLSIDFSRA